MEILGSPLMGAFMAYVTGNWSRRSRVDQSRRRLRHLVAMVRAVADDAEGSATGGGAVRDGSLYTWLHLLRAEALRGQQVLDAAGGGGEGSGHDAAAVAGPARRFLTGLRTLLAGSDEVDRLIDAVEELERLAAPGADLDRFINVFGRQQRRCTGAVGMDVDASPVAAGRYSGQASGCRSAKSVAVAGAELPAPGAKRKRSCTSCVHHGSASHADTGKPQKRRVMPLMRLPADSDRRFTAPSPLPPVSSPDERARTVDLAMARVRRRIGEPTRQRRQAILGEHFSRFSLQ